MAESQFTLEGKLILFDRKLNVELFLRGYTVQEDEGPCGDLFQVVLNQNGKEAMFLGYDPPTGSDAPVLRSILATDDFALRSIMNQLYKRFRLPFNEALLTGEEKSLHQKDYFYDVYEAFKKREHIFRPFIPLSQN